MQPLNTRDWKQTDDALRSSVCRMTPVAPHTTLLQSPVRHRGRGEAQSRIPRSAKMVLPLVFCRSLQEISKIYPMGSAAGELALLHLVERGWEVGSVAPFMYGSSGH